MPPLTEEQQFEPNNVWASATPVNDVEELTLPSGQTCLARRIGLEQIMTSGLLGDADTLAGFVGVKHIRRVRGGKGDDADVIDPQSIMKDPEALKRIVFLIDRAAPQIIVSPEVALHFIFNDDETTTMIDKKDRDPGLVYTDQIGLEDKMFLFQFAVGGTRDLERFREQSRNALDGVPNGNKVPRSTKSTPARSKAKKA